SWKPGSELETRAFIEWQLNTGAILPLSQWLAGGSKPVAKWIYDDLSDSGWVYWGQVLKTDGDTTADFMESVSLIHQPDGDFYYVIHVELDAVSLDELDSWGDVGDEFLKNAPSAKFNSEPPKTVKEGETVNSPGVTVGPEGADQQVTWSSSNRDIATVDANGVVTGVKPGTVTITATAGNGAKVWYTLTVTPGDPTEIPATDVTIQGGDREMEIGDSYTPQIVVTPPDHTDTPQWSSSDPDVAMVDENGKITAVGEGEAVITVTVGDRQDSITVTVKPAADPDLPLQDNTDPFKPDVGTDAESNFCLWLKGDIDDFSKVKVVQAGSVKLKDILLPGTDLDGFSVTAVNSDMDGHFTVGTDKGSDKAILFTYYPPIQTWLDADPNLPQVTTTVILAKEGFKPATITLLLLYEGSIVG
ncbi:MAG: Ig-like domain-containing protein, partial [Oscillospiraceae bacterium]|nr:Ig-like domain-containing protein [Oscillospiraceae bacterium]